MVASLEENEEGRRVVVFPYVRIDLIVELGRVDGLVTHVINMVVLEVALVEEFGDVLDIISVQFFDGFGGREAHRYYAVGDVG